MDDSKTTIKIKDDNCCICLLPLNPDNFAKLDCKHEFHSNCLIEIVRKGNKCPMCRSVIIQEGQPLLKPNFNPVVLEYKSVNPGPSFGAVSHSLINNKNVAEFKQTKDWKYLDNETCLKLFDVYKQQEMITAMNNRVNYEILQGRYVYSAHIQILLSYCMKHIDKLANPTELLNCVMDYNRGSGNVNIIIPFNDVHRYIGKITHPAVLQSFIQEDSVREKLTDYRYRQLCGNYIHDPNMRHVFYLYAVPQCCIVM